MIHRHRYNIRAEYERLDDWSEFLILTNVVIPDDLFVIICARKSSNSYQSDFDKLPQQLSRYFADNNITVVYPTQFGPEDNLNLEELEAEEVMSDVEK